MSEVILWVLLVEEQAVPIITSQEYLLGSAASYPGSTRA